MTVATRLQEPPLLAGALLPPGAEPGGDAPLDPVRAHCYRHPLLSGRPVVRLTGETAATGEQRLLGFLGFDPGVAGPPIARTPRRGLGYVEWVLVHDPAQAEAALAVAAEVDRATRLAHPGLLLKGPHVHGGGPACETLRREFGSRPYRGRGGTAAANGNETADDGLTVAVAGRQGWLALYFRPALLGEHDARAGRLRRWLPLEPGGAARTLAAAIDLLRGQGYTAMAERVRSTPVPPGGYEADPARSAPGTVRAAGAALGLDAEAAVLYLQLLTLLEPTDRNLRRWNRWTPARHRQAAAELLAAGLVLEARRPRAGRRLFLPGEWVPAAAPNLPLEAWKLPLYRLTRDPSDGRPRGPLPSLVPLAPLHELFADAWSRVEMGDRPGRRPQGGTA